MQAREAEAGTYEERHNADEDPIGLDDDRSGGGTDTGSGGGAQEAAHGEHKADEVV